MEAAGESVEQGNQLEKTERGAPEGSPLPEGARPPPGAGHTGSTLEEDPRTSPVAKDILRSDTCTSSVTVSPMKAQGSELPVANSIRSASDDEKERFRSRTDGFVKEKDAMVFAGAAKVRQRQDSDNAPGECIAGMLTLPHLIEPGDGHCHCYVLRNEYP